MPLATPSLPALLRHLSSMNLAITLLVAVAFASIIGTVLQQNQPYADYLIKFGPFWHQMFVALGLYDVYSSAGFLGILAFLVISVCVCVWRNAPGMWAAMRDAQLRRSRRSLQRLPMQDCWQSPHPLAGCHAEIAAALTRCGFRVRAKSAADQVLLGGIRGSANRLGYFFTHIAIVLICLGGLLDGNVPLKWQVARGALVPETAALIAERMAPQSILPVGNNSFRANVSIVEGGRVNSAFIPLGNGALLQLLPFSVELKDFRVEHYSTGQPKSFASDLLIHDPQLPAPLAKTIRVNHPLQHRGYTLYQSSFEDGGSQLTVRGLRFDRAASEPVALALRVHDSQPLPGALAGAAALTLEVNDFRQFNINRVNLADVKVSGKGASALEKNSFRDFGPNFTFKLRDREGAAREYVNYMAPVEQDGRRYLISGVRGTPAEEFRYLSIPVDAQGSASRFFRFYASLHDAGAVSAVIPQVIHQVLNQPDAGNAAYQESLDKAIRHLLQLFLQGSAAEVLGFIDTAVPQAARGSATDAYFKMLNLTLTALYQQAAAGTADAAEINDAITAATAIPLYGAPFFLQLEEYKLLQASGLQITRTPGKWVVYFGFALLISGVFLLFYIAHVRVWVLLTAQQNQTEILLAGWSQRGGGLAQTFGRELARLNAHLRQRLAARDNTETPAGSAGLTH